MAQVQRSYCGRDRKYAVSTIWPNCWTYGVCRPGPPIGADTVLTYCQVNAEAKPLGARERWLTDLRASMVTSESYQDPSALHPRLRREHPVHGGGTGSGYMVNKERRWR